MSHPIQSLIDFAIAICLFVGMPAVTWWVAKQTFGKKRYSIGDMLFVTAVVAFELWILVTVFGPTRGFPMFGIGLIELIAFGSFAIAAIAYVSWSLFKNRRK